MARKIIFPIIIFFTLLAAANVRSLPLLVLAYAEIIFAGLMIALALFQKSRIKTEPAKGFATHRVNVLDKDGKEVDVKKLGTDTYAFLMPESDVDISATFVDSGDGGGHPRGREVRRAEGRRHDPVPPEAPSP